MKRRLHYIWPGGDVVSLTINPDQPFFEPWLYSMMQTEPKCIWFFTVDTTDIFED